MINHRLPDSVLDKMSNSKISFYLTGSTFFTGNIGNDLDYFCEHSESNFRELIAMGFRLHSNSMYCDDNCHTIMRIQKSKFHPQIDVQLVKNVALKSKVQELFKNRGILDPNTADWNIAFKLLEDIPLAGKL